MNAYRHWRSLREIDVGSGCPKGSAFRAFKRLEASLQQGRDYVLLDREQAAAAIATLKNQQRAYHSSVNLLLLSPDAAQRLAEQLGGAPEGPDN